MVRAMVGLRILGSGELLYGRIASIIPIALMVGIGAYFTFPEEPTLSFTASCVAIGVVLIGLGLKLPVGGLLVLVGLMVLGIGVGGARTAWVNAPVVSEELEPRVVYGRLIRVDRSVSRPRLTLDRLWVAGLAPEDTPKRIRVTSSGTIPPVGTRLRLYAVLRPPGPPVAPDAFDFRRYSFFRGIGAVGWTLGAPSIDRRAPVPDATASLRVAIGDLRDRISQRIQETVSGVGGAIAAALLVGDRAGIPRKDLEVIRASGLAHLLAISGLHMALVISAVMVSLRGLMARLPGLGERFPAKKVAALLAFIAGAGYLVLAGAPVSTQRAFVMAGLVLVAILLDRRAISLRLVALAALLILLIAPESLVEPSFQMSFAATAALVAAYERYGRRMKTMFAEGNPILPDWLSGVLQYAAALAFSSTIAILATSPIAAWHFHAFPLYSLPANMMAVPIVGLWVMPLGLFALLVMPFGLDGPVLELMGLGIGLVLDIAWWIGGRPDAVLAVPATPWESLVLWLVAITILLAAPKWWKLFTAAPVVAASLLALSYTPPDALIDGKGRVVALRSDHGFHLSTNRSGRFSAEKWQERAGDRARGALPNAIGRIEGTDAVITCRKSACQLLRASQTIVFVRHGSGLRQACSQADAVISLMRVKIECAAPILVDRNRIDRDGAMALWINEDGIRLEAVGWGKGVRPWRY